MGPHSLDQAELHVGYAVIAFVMREKPLLDTQIFVALFDPIHPNRDFVHSAETGQF
jgi:hypothetical protein